MIWIFSDNAQTRQSLVPLIAARGYPVNVHECGDEVQAFLRVKIPLLVIIDCGMPDSFKVLAHIRAEPRSRSVAVVMFSIADEDLREEALLRGADAYVPKGSLDWAELLVEVVRFAGRPPAP
jgi:CheY-like chemotaxis protein